MFEERSTQLYTSWLSASNSLDASSHVDAAHRIPKFLSLTDLALEECNTQLCPSALSDVNIFSAIRIIRWGYVKTQ